MRAEDMVDTALHPALRSAIWKDETGDERYEYSLDLNTWHELFEGLDYEETNFFSSSGIEQVEMTLDMEGPMTQFFWRRVLLEE